MYTKVKRKQKLKRLAVGLLYFAILLAETGEFFVPHEKPINHSTEKKSHQEEKEHYEDLHLEMPDHAPENHKETSSEIKKNSLLRPGEKRQFPTRLVLDTDNEELYSKNIL